MTQQLLDQQPDAALKKSLQTYQNALKKTLSPSHLHVQQLDNYSQLQQQILAKLANGKNSLCLAIIDIDFFKQVNDNFGHSAGDRVLKIFAEKIMSTVRSADFFARYGGEEFVWLLTDTSLTDATKLVDEVRARIAQTPFHFSGQPVRITFSAGIGALSSKESAADAFVRIDEALYMAKHRGRNQVVSV